MKNINNILLVIASDNEDYYCKFINNYWIPFIDFIEKNNYSIKVFLLFGKKPKKFNNLKESNVIITNTKENLQPGILEKTVCAFKKINEQYNYNYLIRTNLSSFFLIDNLLKVSENLPVNDVYAGFFGTSRYIKNDIYISGSCFWLSKDIVTHIVKNKKKLHYSLFDDIAIGILLRNIKKISLDRYIVNCDDHFDDIINKTKDYYHIRLKSDDRNKDVELITKLTKYYY